MFSGISQYLGFGEYFQKGLSRASNLVSGLTETIYDCGLSCFNLARKTLKSVVQGLNQITDLDSYQNQKSLEALNNAKTRNGAKTQEQLTDYHESIRYSQKNKDGIFLSHKAPDTKKKKLVILLMGNKQSPGVSEEEAGILKIYQDLKEENKHDLLLCRVGSCTRNLLNTIGFNNNPNLNTDVVYEHISNLIEDRIHQDGSFSKGQKPQSIDIVGFSWGAGVQKELEKRWGDISSDFTQVRTVAIDGIQYGCAKLGDELCQRPQYSKQHLNVYQNNEFFLNGEKHNDCKDCDRFIDVDTIDPSEPSHEEIDDSPYVQKEVLKFISQ